MSLFTKRRKKVRLKQEEDRKRWDESVNRTNKSMEDVLKVTKIIEEKYSEFNTMEGDERVKLFAKLYEEVHGKEDKL